MRRTGSMLVGLLVLVGCDVIPIPTPAEPVQPVVTIPISFRLPGGWSLVPEVVTGIFLTSATANPCDGLESACLPETYEMARNSIEVRITDSADESGVVTTDGGFVCSERDLPTWDGRHESGSDETRQAAQRMDWRVCYPGLERGVVIEAWLRGASTVEMDALRGSLRDFIESVELGVPAERDPFAPEK